MKIDAGIQSPVSRSLNSEIRSKNSEAGIKPFQPTKPIQPI
jgi:hypothetical protein